MRLLEEALLARVLHEGSAQKALSRGVHEGWFADPLIKQAWAPYAKLELHAPGLKKILTYGTKMYDEKDRPSR
mgnify:CR=1 FL=1